MTRFGYVMTTYFALLGFVWAAVFPVSPRFIWNASASVPIGLYAIRPAGVLHVTELVAVRPPAALASFLDQRRYLPKGVPMLKRILALPGQTVCRSDRTITVDGIAMGEALDHDRSGRALPTWNGCRVVGSDEVFLMNWQSEDSFDGRYFGPLPASTIAGRADPLWTREED
jgi:conjugative transfer signal peptidase TraF